MAHRVLEAIYAGQGRRRLPRSQPRRAAVQASPGWCRARRAGVMRLLEHAGVALARRARRRHRPLEHRRQAARAPALAEGRDRHHLPFEEPGPRRPRAQRRHSGRRRRPAETRHRPTWSNPAPRDRRRHQPLTPTASSAATSISLRPRSRGLDHTGARRRRPDDHRDAPGKLCARRAAMHEPPNDNPLLDFSGLPRFERAQARARHAGHRAAARRGPRRHQAARSRHRDLGQLRRAAGRRERAPRPRLGPGRAPERGAGQPELREAYNANLPKVTQYWTELGQNQRLFDEVQGAARSARVRSAACARASSIVENELRDFRLGGAELPRGQEGALTPRSRKSSRALSAQFLGQPARRDQRVFASTSTDEAELAGIPDDVLAGRRARPRAGRTARPAGSSRCTCPATCR